MRKAVGVVAVVLGAAAIVATLTLDAFGAARSGQRLLNGARPTLRDDVSELRGHTQTVVSTSNELIEGVVPRLAYDMANLSTRSCTTASATT
jgi:ABC-type transporter Mla subunit MlaD